MLAGRKNHRPSAAECLAVRYCNSGFRLDHGRNPEEIPLTSVRTTSDDTDQDDSPCRRPAFTGNDKRREGGSLVGSASRVAKWSQFNMTIDARKTPSSRGSLFTNFEDVQLTDEERVYLNAAALGDVPIIRQSLEETNDVSLNVNCVDYMGRSALHLAVDSESMEAVELLLDRINFECIEESLLHAISKGATKIVKVMIEHPNYIAGAELYRRTQKDPFFRTDEKSQFSPDITPLILAAHYNNHEIIQMFLSRNQTIDRPHPISCQCADCVTKQTWIIMMGGIWVTIQRTNSVCTRGWRKLKEGVDPDEYELINAKFRGILNYDSLKRSRSRLNAYRALASPAYMALSSPDPIMTTFELRQEMKKLAQVEKEFKNEYLSLVEICMNFACELMDLCRGTQEVEAVLSEGRDQDGVRDPLARLKMAMEYEEKKFVAHPNCQQHLTSIWFGPEMGFMQSLTLWKKLLLWLVAIPLLPVVCLAYIIAPHSKVGNALRCPASKFITHTLSHLCFLVLLAAATFRLDEKSYQTACTISCNWTDLLRLRENDTYREQVDNMLKATFRPANVLMTNVQICLMFWILGLLWMECKAMYNSGLRVYLLDNYNWVDFIVLSVYLSSYVLRFLVDHRIKVADHHYNGTAMAREALLDRDVERYDRIRDSIYKDRSAMIHSYFMKASRFDWSPDDPEIVSDVLFAIANVISIARTTYLMPAFEVLGPLQISLGRMIGDITRFLVLFTLVLFAFMVGLHNLYWYYGTQTYKKEGTDKLIHTSEAFQGLPRTLFSLFWAMFGLVNVDSVEIKYPAKERGSMYVYSFPGGNTATSVVEGVGMFLFALYHVAIIIVLVNMLIAMMSHSFEDIQTDCDVEWKFARTGLWMNYIDVGGTVPVPFNMIPTPKSCRCIYRWMRAVCRGKGSRDHADDDDELMDGESTKKQTFIRKRREKVCANMNIETPHNSYADILQRLVRRYLFKLERQKEEGKDSVGVGAENIFSGATTVSTDANETGYLDVRDSTAPPGYKSVTPNSTGYHQNLPILDADAAVPTSNMIPPSPIVGGQSTITTAGTGGQLRRRVSFRATAARQRRSASSTSPAIGPLSPQPPSASSNAASQIQLLSIPQLDSIQRTLRILDVRLQHVQSNARDDDRTRADIEHIRRLMSENQNALATVITVLSSIQEEVRRLSIAVHRQQTSILQIQPPPSASVTSSGMAALSGSSAVGQVLSTMTGNSSGRSAVTGLGGVRQDGAPARDRDRLARGSIPRESAALSSTVNKIPTTSAASSSTAAVTTTTTPVTRQSSTGGVTGTTTSSVVVLGSGVESSPL